CCSARLRLPSHTHAPNQPPGADLLSLAAEGELLRRAHREDQNHIGSYRRRYLRSRLSARQQLAPACTNNRRHFRPEPKKRSLSSWLRILLRPPHPTPA